jgi:hypothetical protein
MSAAEHDRLRDDRGSAKPLAMVFATAVPVMAPRS